MSVDDVSDVSDGSGTPSVMALEGTKVGGIPGISPRANRHR